MILSGLDVCGASQAAIRTGSSQTLLFFVFPFARGWMVPELLWVGLAASCKRGRPSVTCAQDRQGKIQSQ